MISADEIFFLLTELIPFYTFDANPRGRKWWQISGWLALPCLLLACAACSWGCCRVALGPLLCIGRHWRKAPHWLSTFCLKKKKGSSILLLKCFQIFYIAFPFLSFQPPPFFFPLLWSWRPPCKSTWHHERELNVLERPLLFWWELLCNCKVPIKAQVVS